MPVDSQVVNGRIIGPGGAMPTSLEIDRGRIVSVDTETDVWRTVDASGYFVLPGAVQPGDPTVGQALPLVGQGICTAVVEVTGGLEELETEIERLSREALLDFCVCWKLLESATTENVRHARNLGIHVFDVTDRSPDADIGTALNGATLRSTAASASLNNWLQIDADVNFVVSVSSADDLQHLLVLAQERRSNIFLEVDSGTLTGDAPLWDKVGNGYIDIVAMAGDSAALLQYAHREGVEMRGLPIQRLVDLLATNPANAYRLNARKGRLEPGNDADFAVFDPEQIGEVGGASVQGKVVYAQLRGDIFLFNDELHVAPGNGRMVPG